MLICGNIFVSQGLKKEDMKKNVLLLVMCLPLIAQAQEVENYISRVVQYRGEVLIANALDLSVESLDRLYEQKKENNKRDRLLREKEFLKAMVNDEQVLLDAALKDLKEWQEICQSECEHVKRARSDAGVIKVRLENAKKAYKKFCDEHPNL